MKWADRWTQRRHQPICTELEEDRRARRLSFQGLWLWLWLLWWKVLLLFLRPKIQKSRPGIWNIVGSRVVHCSGAFRDTRGSNQKDVHTGCIQTVRELLRGSLPCSWGIQYRSSLAWHISWQLLPVLRSSIFLRPARNPRTNTKMLETGFLLLPWPWAISREAFWVFTNKGALKRKSCYACIRIGVCRSSASS